MRRKESSRRRIATVALRSFKEGFMTHRMPLLRQSRGLLLLGVCLLLLGLLPAQSTLAAFKNLPIDNTLTDFARGTFQRASLGAVSIPSIPNQKIADENGA